MEVAVMVLGTLLGIAIAVGMLLRERAEIAEVGEARGRAWRSAVVDLVEPARRGPGGTLVSPR